MFIIFSVVTGLHFMLLSKITELLQSSLEGKYSEILLKDFSYFRQNYFHFSFTFWLKYQAIMKLKYCSFYSNYFLLKFNIQILINLNK